MKEATNKKIIYDWQDKTILIVEDENINFSYLEAALRNTKAKVLHAINGKEAVEIFRQNPDISLILMDIKMPEMNGYEATTEIKKINKTVPVIAQTAYAFIEDRQKAMDAGCDEYISKPIKRKDLLEKISKLLSLILLFETVTIF